MPARVAATFSRLGRATQFAILAALVVAVFAIDYLSGYDVSTSLFYLLPITLGTWVISRRTGLVLSLVSAGLWLTADLLSGHHYRNGLIPLWNVSIRFAFFCIIVVILAALQATLEQRDSVIGQLEKTLRNAKTLDGVRPICHSCRRIRDTEHGWQNAEDFLREKSEIEFATSVCPDCAAVPAERSRR
jgi:hypothetical protein